MLISDLFGDDTGPITDIMGSFAKQFGKRVVKESAREDNEDISMEKRAATVIATMKRATTKLPITCEMRPYKNRYTGDVQGVVLTDLFADQPGGGVGTKVMNLMVKLADAADINIYTDAEGPRSHDFYLRFGFVDDRSGGHQLVHYPPLDLDED